MYSRATIDFNSPESVVMAITDYIEFTKDIQKKKVELLDRVEELEELLEEERASGSDLDRQVAKQELLIESLENKIKDLTDEISVLKDRTE